MLALGVSGCSPADEGADARAFTPLDGDASSGLVFIRGAGDKGVSAGEGSELSSFDTTIESVEIAVASKDDSRVEMTNLTISEARLGFAVYNKKPEYGPGHVDAHFAPTHSGGPPSFLLEDESFLRFDGEPQAPNQRNVVDDLYGEKYGKRTQ